MMLTSCLSDPTEGVVVPDYDEPEEPVTPPDEPEETKPDYSLPLDRGAVHLKGRQLQSLNVISATGLTDAEKVVVSTLAGIAARVSGDQVYLNEGGPASVWLREMKDVYKIPAREYSNLASLVAHYRDAGIINGYIVYRPYSSGNSHSVNVATSLCGILGGIAVAEDMVETIKGMGIETELANVADKDEKWLLENYGNELDKTLASDLAANISTLSSIYDPEGLKQRPATTDDATEENVHYVTFVVSDGDNVAFNLWGMQSYIDADVHGQFPLGMTISPVLYDLAPATMRWYYDFAGENAYFIAGPSGRGYVFPSKMSDADLDSYLVRLNDYVDKSGLNIVNILDQGIMNNPRVYNKYLAQPNIDAIFYTGYGEKGDGRIVFSDNGKPVIEQGSVLWAGIDGGSTRGEESSVIAQINGRPANPHSAAGYTFVFVHCWTKDQMAIKRVIDGLNSNVRVVSPDRFVALVKKNLR